MTDKPTLALDGCGQVPMPRQCPPGTLATAPGAGQDATTATVGRTVENGRPVGPPNQTAAESSSPVPCVDNSGTSPLPAAEISIQAGKNGGVLKRGGVLAHKAAKAARQDERRGRADTREGVLAILREIAADEDESGAYRTAAARLLLAPETGAGDWSCPLPCCQGRPFETVGAWIEAMRQADTIAPPVLSPTMRRLVDKAQREMAAGVGDWDKYAPKKPNGNGGNDGAA